jgi:hypothetical protein
MKKLLSLLLTLLVATSLWSQQPAPYVVDSGLTIAPILENDDLPGYRYISDVKLVYPRPAYCSDSIRAVFIFSDRVLTKPLKKWICTSPNGWLRLTTEESLVLSRVPLLAIRLENTATGESYNHALLDSEYFIRVYSRVDRW